MFSLFPGDIKIVDVLEYLNHFNWKKITNIRVKDTGDIEVEWK